MRARPRDARVNARRNRSARAGSWRPPSSWAAGQLDAHVYAFVRLGDQELVWPLLIHMLRGTLEAGWQS